MRHFLILAALAIFAACDDDEPPEDGGVDGGDLYYLTACSAFCAQEAACWSDDMQGPMVPDHQVWCVEGCTSNGSLMSPEDSDECNRAILDQLVCYSEVPCEDFLDHEDWSVICPEIGEGVGYCPPLGI